MLRYRPGMVSRTVGRIAKKAIYTPMLPGPITKNRYGVRVGLAIGN